MVEVALAGLEEEVVHGVGARGLVVDLEAEAVVVRVTQVVLDLERREVGGVGVARDVDGQLAHALRQAVRELQVALRDPRGVLRAHTEENLGVGRRDRPDGHVAVAGTDPLPGLQRREVDTGRAGDQLCLDVGREGIADRQETAVGERFDHLDLRDDGTAQLRARLRRAEARGLDGRAGERVALRPGELPAGARVLVEGRGADLEKLLAAKFVVGRQRDGVHRLVFELDAALQRQRVVEVVDEVAPLRVDAEEDLPKAVDSVRHGLGDALPPRRDAVELPAGRDDP